MSGMKEQKPGTEKYDSKKVMIYPLFPSMVSCIDCDDFTSIKDDLIEWIYDYKKNTDKQLYRSNSGGWHSYDNLNTIKSFERFNDYIKYNISILCDSLVGDDCTPAVDYMWTIINSGGNENYSHQHPGSHISGCLWVKSQGEESGNIIFENPNSFGQEITLTNMREDLKQPWHAHPSFWFVPVEGRMVIFPSDLRHNVERNSTSEDRIVISFNIMLRPKEGEPSFYRAAGMEKIQRVL